MATNLTSTIFVAPSASTTKDGRSTTVGINDQRQFTNGTSADQADKAYYDKRTVAYTSTPDNLDFAGGGLIDTNGDALTWVEMTTLIIKADADNTGNLVVGGHASPLDFGSGANTITIQPGETKVLINTSTNPAYVVTAGSADTLKVVQDSGVDAIYEIFAQGRSA